MQLCHVMSWTDIRCIFDRLFEDAYYAEKMERRESNYENYGNITTFITKLFQLDDEAVVNFGAWYPPLTFDAWNYPNKSWYEQTPVFRTFVDGKQHIGVISELHLRNIMRLIE